MFSLPSCPTFSGCVNAKRSPCRCIHVSASHCSCRRGGCFSTNRRTFVSLGFTSMYPLHTYTHAASAGGTQCQRARKTLSQVGGFAICTPHVLNLWLANKQPSFCAACLTACTARVSCSPPPRRLFQPEDPSKNLSCPHQSPVGEHEQKTVRRVVGFSCRNMWRQQASIYFRSDSFTGW